MSLRKFLVVFFYFSLFTFNLNGQVSFKKINGIKANYSITIPENYSSKATIGLNVDFKYVNSDGASIVSLIKKIDKNLGDYELNELVEIDEIEFKNQLESTGLENLKINKRGFIEIDQRKTFYTIYNDGVTYFYSIIQFRSGTLVNITYSCLFQKRFEYLPVINRVLNSLKFID